MILGHKAEGQTRPELQEQGRQSVQGIINVPREDQVSDQIFKFLGERSQEINALIRDLPGYIAERIVKD